MADLSKRSLGRWGEQRAASHYRSQGYDVVDRNWRAPERQPPGELDLVLRRGGLVVFCEVKSRRSAGYGGAAVAVDTRKQARIRALAEAWLRHHGVADVDVRFDVVTVEGITLAQYEAAF